MKNNIVEIVKDEVYRRCLSEGNSYGIGAWTHHIAVVYKIAVDNSSLYNADLEVVSLAALLHDIASVTDIKYAEEHHVVGAEMAAKLLTDLQYDETKLTLVKNCILNHRGSVLKEKLTNEEICIADADAMTHFYNIPSLLSMVYREKKMGIDEGATFVNDKLQRSYNKLSEQGKKIIESQYRAAQLILKTN